MVAQQFIDGILRTLNRDAPLVISITLLYGSLLIGFNIAINLLRAGLDPRMRHG